VQAKAVLELQLTIQGTATGRLLQLEPLNFTEKFQVNPGEFFVIVTGLT